MLGGLTLQNYAGKNTWYSTPMEIRHCFQSIPHSKGVACLDFKAHYTRKVWLSKYVVLYFRGVALKIVGTGKEVCGVGSSLETAGWS